MLTTLACCHCLLYHFRLNPETLDPDSKFRSQFLFFEIFQITFEPSYYFILVISKTGKGSNISQKSSNAKKVVKSHLLDASEAEKIVGTNSVSTVLFNFTAEKAGSYAAKIILYALDNMLDVRILALAIQTSVPRRTLILSFKGPARQELTQEIPILNSSDGDWILTASIQGMYVYCRQNHLCLLCCISVLN